MKIKYSLSLQRTLWKPQTTLWKPLSHIITLLISIYFGKDIVMFDFVCVARPVAEAPLTNQDSVFINRSSVLSPTSDLTSTWTCETKSNGKWNLTVDKWGTCCCHPDTTWLFGTSADHRSQLSAQVWQPAGFLKGKLDSKLLFAWVFTVTKL